MIATMGYMKFLLCSTTWRMPIYSLRVPSCLHRYNRLRRVTFSHAPWLRSNIKICLIITTFVTFIILWHLHIFCIFSTILNWGIFLRVCYGGLFFRIRSTCSCIWQLAKITNMRGWLGRLWCDEQVMLFIAVLPKWIWIIVKWIRHGLVII